MSNLTQFKNELSVLFTALVRGIISTIREHEQKLLFSYIKPMLVKDSSIPKNTKRNYPQQDITHKIEK